MKSEKVIASDRPQSGQERSNLVLKADCFVGLGLLAMTGSFK